MSVKVNDREEVRIELIKDENEMKDYFLCQYETFGMQTKDGFWASMNPNFETEEGRERSIEGVKKRFQKSSAHNGVGHSWFLKAIVKDLETGKETIGGIATWTEMMQSRNPVPTEFDQTILKKMYPENEKEQRFAQQMFQSFVKRRGELVKEAGKEGRSVMVLDICVVRPNFQRRGLASLLVKWGLRKAEELGQDGQSIECITEASSMGKPVYLKLGFQPEMELEFKVDEEFKDRQRPPNTILRRPAGTKLIE